jgi:hypothetical protein
MQLSTSSTRSMMHSPNCRQPHFTAWPTSLVMRHRAHVSFLQRVPGKQPFVWQDTRTLHCGALRRLCCTRLQAARHSCARVLHLEGVQLPSLLPSGWTRGHRLQWHHCWLLGTLEAQPQPLHKRCVFSKLLLMHPNSSFANVHALRLHTHSNPPARDKKQACR